VSDLLSAALYGGIPSLARWYNPGYTIEHENCHLHSRSSFSRRRVASEATGNLEKPALHTSGPSLYRGPQTRPGARGPGRGLYPGALYPGRVPGTNAVGFLAQGRLVVWRGEIWWASLPDPRGSGPGLRRPVLVIQSNPFNESQIRTVIVAIITSNLRLADAPGNVLLERVESGLPRDSVVNVSQILTVDKSFLTERVRMLRTETIGRVDAGLKLALGL